MDAETVYARYRAYNKKMDALISENPGMYGIGYKPNGKIDIMHNLSEEGLAKLLTYLFPITFSNINQQKSSDLTTMFSLDDLKSMGYTGENNIPESPTAFIEHIKEYIGFIRLDQAPIFHED